MSEADRHPWPAAPAGQRRWVIDLPACSATEAGDRLVQLRVGAPGPARAMLPVDWQSQQLEGWGYPYWLVSAAGGLLMPRDDDAGRQMAWSPPQVLRYNPQLPLVVYGPQAWALRWRVLVASGDYIDAE